MKAIRNFSFLGYLLCVSAAPAWAFDLEDYAGSFRVTRDAWLLAQDQYELAVNAYRNYRASAVAEGIDPDDDIILSIIDGEDLTKMCQSANHFTAASSAYGRFITHASAYVDTSDLGALHDELENSMTAYRSGLDDAITVFDNSRPEAFIPGGASNATAYQVLLRDLLIDAADEVMKTGWELSLATPVYQAALAAYKAASNTYTAALRLTGEFNVVRSADVRQAAASPDPRLDFIEPLPNDLKSQ